MIISESTTGSGKVIERLQCSDSHELKLRSFEAKKPISFTTYTAAILPEEDACVTTCIGGAIEIYYAQDGAKCDCISPASMDPNESRMWADEKCKVCFGTGIIGGAAA